MEALEQWSEHVYWYAFLAMVFSGVAVILVTVALYSLQRRIDALREHLVQAVSEVRSEGGTK
jgi:hypothetical protein